MSQGALATSTERFGCERFGRLKRAMVHRPGNELRIINEENKLFWLFDKVPDVGAYAEEHERYCELLREHGVEVLELMDWVTDSRWMIQKLPNLTFMHDIAVVSSKGAILSSMATGGRRGEDVVVREALRRLGVPVAIDFEDGGDMFEGCLLIGADAVLVAETERHSKSAVEKFVASALNYFDEVIHVNIPKARRYMHPDTIFNRVKHDLGLAYLPAFESVARFTKRSVELIDFAEYMGSRGVELINVSDEEQRDLACTFVPLEPGVMFHYDDVLSRETRRKLEKRGVELILFHADAMKAGGGSLRCHTLRLFREANGEIR